MGPDERGQQSSGLATVVVCQGTPGDFREGPPFRHWVRYATS